MELDGDRPAPQRSIHAKRCLSRQQSSTAKERAKKRFDELNRERAERLKLATEAPGQSDSESHEEPDSSSSSDAGDDSDWGPVERDRQRKPRKQARIGIRNDGDHSDSEDEGCGASERLASAEPSQPAARAANARVVGARGGPGGRGRGGSQSKVRRRGASRDSGQKAKVARGGGVVQELAEQGSLDSESEDLDTPLVEPQAAAAAAVAAAAFVATPTVGATVEIKWDPTTWATDKGGWCTGVVKVISDGKAPAPQNPGRKRKRRTGTVKAGHSIVEYGNDGLYVHLLDQAHHVSNLGDKVDAWRLLSSPWDAGSGAGGEADQLGGRGRNNGPCLQAGAAQLSAAGAGGEGGGSLVRATGAQRGGRGGHSSAQASVDNDDDVPLFPVRSVAGNDSAEAGARAGAAADNAVLAAAVPECQPRASIGGASRQRDPPSRCVASTQVPKNVWSLSYCFRAFDNIQPEHFRRGVAKFSAGLYTVTRQMPTTGEFPSEANIKIPVKTESSKMYYIAYTAETGLTLFAVTMLRKPQGDDWSKTLTGYQVFTAEEALNRVDREEDVVGMGCATSIGAKSLRFQISMDRNRSKKTYHACDWKVHMDVRCIVGVVRQALDKHRGTYERSAHERSGCPAKASLIFTGDPFSENRDQRLAQS